MTAFWRYSLDVAKIAQSLAEELRLAHHSEGFLALAVDYQGGGQVVGVEGTRVTLAVASLDVAPDLARLLVGAGYQLYGMVPVQRSLEDIFVDLVGEVQEG